MSNLNGKYTCHELTTMRLKNTLERQPVSNKFYYFLGYKLNISYFKNKFDSIVGA